MITKRRKGNKAQAKIPARNNIITTNIQIFSSRKLSHCYDRQPLQYELTLIKRINANKGNIFFSQKDVQEKLFFTQKNSLLVNL